MKKLSFEDILKPNTVLKAHKLEDTEELRKAIAHTKEQQEKILKQKEVSQEILEIRMTI